MGKGTSYEAKTPDAAGRIAYSAQENATWAALHARQSDAVAAAACPEYLRGLALLDLPAERIPQIPEINRVLQRETGWAVEPVPALIPFGRFFELLASRRFPAATFIRRRVLLPPTCGVLLGRQPCRPLVCWLITRARPSGSHWPSGTWSRPRAWPISWLTTYCR